MPRFLTHALFNSYIVVMVLLSVLMKPADGLSTEKNRTITAAQQETLNDFRIDRCLTQFDRLLYPLLLGSHSVPVYQEHIERLPDRLEDVALGLRTAALNAIDNRAIGQDAIIIAEDLKKILNHALLASIVNIDNSYLRSRVSEFVYYLHIVDDALDIPESQWFTNRNAVINTWFEAEVNLKISPLLIMEKLGAIRMPRDGLVSQKIRNHFRNLFDVIEIMVHSLPPTAKRSNVRKLAILKSVFHIVAGAYTHQFIEDESAYHEVMAFYKGRALTELKNNMLVRTFAQFPDHVFILLSKGTMHALMALEAQRYSEERSFVWSLLFSPFLYDWGKSRHHWAQIDATTLEKLVKTAFSSLEFVPDQLLAQRLKQLRIILKAWPHNIPENVVTVYWSQINYWQDQLDHMSALNAPTLRQPENNLTRAKQMP